MDPNSVVHQLILKLMRK